MTYVTYNANGGTGNAPVDPNIYPTLVPYTFTPLPNSNLTLLNNAFGGWNTKADGSGIHYTPGVLGNAFGDLTLYAEWIDIGILGDAIIGAAKVIMGI